MPLRNYTGGIRSESRIWFQSLAITRDFTADLRCLQRQPGRRNRNHQRQKPSRYRALQPGTAHITAKATDLDGANVSQTFTGNGG